MRCHKTHIKKRQAFFAASFKKGKSSATLANMVYVCGIIGFVLGFAVGIGIINLFLHNRPRADLMHNKSLRWTYGLPVWILAGASSWVATQIYHHFE